MAKKRNFGRNVSGVLIVDKPEGETSNTTLQHAKRLLFAAKAGHTGSLDPFATGVLPMCFGEATKFSQYLLDADKEYLATFVFGVATDTADRDGSTVFEADASALGEGAIRKAMEQYRGDILQVPPMYSALKKDGKPLYELARKGIEVDRQARPVSVHTFDLLEFRPGHRAEIDCRIHCSKGTYVRSLAEDLGRDLGLGAHVGKLRRTKVGPFVEAQAISLQALAVRRGEGKAEVLDDVLLPVAAPLCSMGRVALLDTIAFYFMQGQAVMDAHLSRGGSVGDLVQVYNESGNFLGVGQLTDESTVTPRRLVVM